MKIGMVCRSKDWRGSENMPHRSVLSGLERLGHTVEPCASPPFDNVDCVFTWNLAKSDWWPEFIAGHKVFVMERGWFNRMEYTQIDTGFNHTASWAHEVSGPAPIEGVERLWMLSELLSPPIPVECRQSGYVLILGQTGNDTQLKQSEIHHPDTLCGSVVANLPAGLEAVFRPHPLNKWRPDDIEIADGTLDAALSGARFVVTINSNAGNDALWAGCPVLCLGPALYEIAGVARRTSVATMLHDMEMMKRWQPDARRVISYLHWLASKQWNRAELKQGDCLRQLLGE